MNIEKELQKRSAGNCELCSAKDASQIYEVVPVERVTVETSIFLCHTCKSQIEEPEKIDANHWRCLNDSMWSTIPAVQVMSWRMLTRLRSEGWPQDLLDMLYLDEDTLEWAKAGVDFEDDDVPKHLDINGTALKAGDTVTLIKDLIVKGGGFTAKRGTAVRGISLVYDNPEQIEGKVNGQQIIITTKFVKKSN